MSQDIAEATTPYISAWVLQYHIACSCSPGWCWDSGDAGFLQAREDFLTNATISTLSSSCILLLMEIDRR